MELFDIESCLNSMSVLTDTREQPSDRAQKRYQTFGVPFRRQTLNYGDYTFNFVMPDGKEYYQEGVTISPDVMIERKKDLEELSQCFCQSRDRFRREFERAAEAGASIYLIIEDSSWEKLLTGKYNTKFNCKAFTASLVAWMIRYNIKPIFCKHEVTGRLIKEILYRELKDRLERGVYG